MRYEWEINAVFMAFQTGCLLGFIGIYDGIPAGNVAQFAIEYGPVEIVSVPIQHGDFPIDGI